MREKRRDLSRQQLELDPLATVRRFELGSMRRQLVAIQAHRRVASEAQRVDTTAPKDPKPQYSSYWGGCAQPTAQ